MQPRPPEEIKSIDLAHYTPFIWQDREGKQHSFMGHNQTLEGGESIVRFGYDRDDEGNIILPKKAFRIVKPERKSREEYKKAIKLEILVTKMLYKNTSEMMRFFDGTLGYSMDLLPGIDFLKKPKYQYDCIVIHKNKEINALEFKDNQLVFSEEAIYWIEDGIIRSFNMAELKKLNSKIMSDIREYLEHNDGSVFTENDFEGKQLYLFKSLIREIQSCVHCCAHTLTSYDDTEFKKLHLTFLQRCQIVCDLAKQLNTLHQKNYFHGDINPTNIKIYLDEHGNAHANLFDFGQSRLATHLADDYSAGTLQDFLSPETAEHHYTIASDMFSLAGIIGMLFTKNPNDFIKDRLLKARELTQYGEMLAVLPTTPYNIDEMFINMQLDATPKELRLELKDFVGRLMAHGDHRPTSHETVDFFDSLIQKNYTLFIRQRLQEINTQSKTFLPPFMTELKKRCQFILRLDSSPDEKMAALSKELDTFEQFCKIAYQCKDIPRMLSRLVKAHRDNTPPPHYEVPVKPVTIFMPPLPAMIDRTSLSKRTTRMIDIINRTDKIGDLFDALKNWAEAALIYQTTKKTSTSGRLFSQGTLKNFNTPVTTLLKDIIRHHGDMSKLTKDGIPLENQFHEINKHSHGTVMNFLGTLLVAYNTKLSALMTPKAEYNLTLKPR